MGRVINGEQIWMRIKNGVVQFRRGMEQMWLNEQAFATVHPDIYSQMGV